MPSSARRRCGTAMATMGRSSPLRGRCPALPKKLACGSCSHDRPGRQAILLPGALLDPRPASAAAIVIGMGGAALRGMAFAKAVVVIGEQGSRRARKPSTVSVAAGFTDATTACPETVTAGRAFGAWPSPSRGGGTPAHWRANLSILTFRSKRPRGDRARSAGQPLLHAQAPGECLSTGCGGPRSISGNGDPLGGFGKTVALSQWMHRLGKIVSFDL